MVRGRFPSVKILFRECPFITMLSWYEEGDAGGCQGMSGEAKFYSLKRDQLNNIEGGISKCNLKIVIHKFSHVHL